jgi:hypothetical protein
MCDAYAALRSLCFLSLSSRGCKKMTTLKLPLYVPSNIEFLKIA